MEQDFDLIIRVLKRTRVSLIGYGIFWIGMAVVCGLIYILRYLPIIANSNALFQIGFTLFNVVGIFLFLKNGINFLANGIRWWNVEQSPLFILLKEYPNHIVWIFEISSKNKQLQSTVNVWLDDGEKHTLVVKQEEKPALIQALSRFAPNARLDYQPEWIKVYKQDPSNFVIASKTNSQ